MKYKIYPVIFVLILVGFMSIFGGILDIEAGADCPDTDLQVEFGSLAINSNGNQASVQQSVILKCQNAFSYEDDCSGDTECYYDLYGGTHYNDSISVSVIQGGSVVQTISSVIGRVKDSDDFVTATGTISNTISFVSKGEYVLRYTIVCAGGTTSTKDTSITITEGINGNFALQELDVTCSETGNTFNYKPEHFIGDNILFIENTNFNMKLNMVAEVSATDYPCIESGYELDEGGTFSSNANTVTISYDDGSASVSQTFTYTYDGENFVLNSAEAGEDAVRMSFKKQTVLAKR